MSTETLVAVILVLGLSTLAVLLWSWKTKGDAERRPADPPDFDSVAGGSDCPLCGEHLPRGERVHSEVFPGKEFDLMRIHGCRHCWSGHAAAVPSAGLNRRRCPSCGAELPENGYVMARVYHRAQKRTHVNVYGCTVCTPGRG